MEQWHVVIMWTLIDREQIDTWVEFVRATSRADADAKARPQLIKRLIDENEIEGPSQVAIDEFAIVICTGDTEPTYPSNPER